jgi:methionyl-tRNA synthetase
MVSRLFSVSSNPSDRKIVVTSALPYANGEIHLGHIVSTYLPADIFTRYCRSKGYNVVHVCASDDFGTPILIRAEQEGKTPEEYVTQWNRRDLQDFTDLGIIFNLFSNTSSNENIELTQHVFHKLSENGYINQRMVLQPYCENDRKFLPDRYVIGTCPYCGAENQYSDSCEKCGRTFQPGEIKDPKCALCGAIPVQRQSEHFFFRLSQFSERLYEWLTQNKNLQDEVKNYVLRWIQDGLKDWDITRDMSWGVPIPEAPGKVFYGWFDNHLCYISSTLTYFERRGVDGKAFWNSAEIYHYIGKDIVYHHYLFLPAMRMGVDEEYKLPNYIPTRGHLMLQGNKFSKSRGWYVSLRGFLDSFPADYLRYYLAAITSYSQSDINFDWDDFHARINNELVANIGNFIHRTLNFIKTHHNGEVPTPEEYDEVDQVFEARLLGIRVEVESSIETNEFDKALKKIIDFSADCNRYFQKREPWKKGKGDLTCLYLSVNAVKTLAILLEPYLYSTKPLWTQIGFEKPQLWDNASKIDVNPGHKIGEPKILFRKIEDAEIQREKMRLGKTGGSADADRKKLLKSDIGEEETKLVEVTYDEFAKIDLRIGEVVDAERLEGSNKLLKLQIDIGGERRQSISGIAEHYTPEELKGKMVTVITNLKPRKVFGEVSEVMLLAALDKVDDKENLALLRPDRDVSAGSEVS